MERFVKACRLTLIAVAISFGGWCFEKVGRYVVYGGVGDRGFLHLPLCPIYGISTALIFLLTGTPRETQGVVGRLITRAVSRAEKKRTRVRIRGGMRDLRLFYNSVDRAVEMVKRCGLMVESHKEEGERETRLIICIPKAN